MIKINRTIGRHYDLTRGSSGGTIPQQLEPRVGKIDMQYSEGLPTVVLKYSDATKTTLLYTTSIIWSNGVPLEVITLNHSNGITATTTLEWDNGKLVSIDKVTT